MGKKELDIKLSKVNSSLNSAIRWVEKSGIQNFSGKNNGSVNAWYDPKRKKYSFIYSEINGYFLTTCVYLFRKTKRKEFIELALKSAKWLIKKAQHKNGGFRCLFILDQQSPHSFKQDQIYAFDNGVILNGLVSLYKITKKKYILRSAIKCASWVMNICVNKSYSVKPLYEISENKFYESDKDWSTISGSYHTKIAMGLANLYTVKKQKKYLRFAYNICKKSLEFQNNNGRFLSFPFRGGTNLHPHCYSAEGLWSVGQFFNNKTFIKSSQKATQWIYNTLKKGVPPRLYLIERIIYHQRADALAQTLRLFFLHRISGKKIITKEKNINIILQNLLKFQFKNNKNKKINGSFKWGKTSYGKLKPHSNSWVTFFSIQTLYLIKDTLEKKKLHLEPFDLI